MNDYHGWLLALVLILYKSKSTANTNITPLYIYIRDYLSMSTHSIYEYDNIRHWAVFKTSRPNLILYLIYFNARNEIAEKNGRIYTL